MLDKLNKLLAYVAMCLIIGSFVTFPVIATSEYGWPASVAFFSVITLPTLIAIAWLDKVITNIKVK